jgi:hypothetical protein
LSPDAVALYDVSDPASPLLLGRYNFPINQVANANVIAQTVIAGSRIYALDANNGLLAFNINPPASSVTVNIARAGSNINLWWSNQNAVLQKTSGFNPPVWSDLTTVGQTNFLDTANQTARFYRLVVRNN